MSTAEITAYLYGVKLAGEGQPVITYLRQSHVMQRAMLDVDEKAAFDKLKGDRWSHWVARGFWETAGTGRVVPEV